MNPIHCLARLLLFLALSTFARAADLPRVAVMSDSPEPSLAAFADFLSVSLRLTSTNNGLILRSLILSGKEDEMEITLRLRNAESENGKQYSELGGSCISGLAFTPWISLSTRSRGKSLCARTSFFLHR